MCFSHRKLVPFFFSPHAELISSPFSSRRLPVVFGTLQSRFFTVGSLKFHMILQLANREHSAVVVRPAETPLHSQAGLSSEPTSTTTTTTTTTTGEVAGGSSLFFEASQELYFFGDVCGSDFALNASFVPDVDLWPLLINARRLCLHDEQRLSGICRFVV